MTIRGKLMIIRAPNKTVFFCFLMFSFVFLIGASGALFLACTAFFRLFDLKNVEKALLVTCLISCVCVSKISRKSGVKRNLLSD